MFDWFFDGIASILKAIAQSLFNYYATLMGSVTSSTAISAPLEQLFGGADVWNMVRTMHQTLLIPLAESILALIMLVQLVKISQRIDSTSTLPAVKDIVFLAVFYVLFHWLIVNSLDIVTTIYNIFNHITASILPSDPNFTSSFDLSGVDADGDYIGGFLMLVLFGFISVITGAIAYVVALVVAFARSLQIYVMAAFSPVPLSLLGFEETRSMGIGYLKNFAAVALAGTIMVFVMYSYPFLLASVSGVDSGGLAAVATGTNDGLNSLLTVLAISVVYIFALAKSGAWARELLGS